MTQPTFNQYARNQNENLKFAQTADGKVAVRVVGSSGSTQLDVNTVSVDTTGLIGKTNNGDFTITYASSNSLTISGLSFNLKSEDIVSVEQYSSQGTQKNRYTRDDTRISVSGNTITVSGANFVSTDKFIVYTNINKKYVSSDSVELANSQALTSSYADLSGEIDINGINKIGIFIDADVNDSENVTMKLYGLYESGGTEYELNTNGEQSLWTTGASDFSKYYEINTGVFRYLKIKVKADTVGTTAGTITAHITKGRW